MNDDLVFRNGVIISLSLCATTFIAAVGHKFWFRRKIAQSIGDRPALSDDQLISSQSFAIPDKAALLLVLQALGDFYSVEYGKLRNSDRFDKELLPPISALWLGMRNKAGNYIAARLLQQYPEIDFSTQIADDNIITIGDLAKHFCTFVPIKK